MGKYNPAQTKLLFSTLLDDSWPDHKLFPLNLRNLNRKVQSEVEKDITASDEYLIITGFTSLSHLVDMFGYGTFPNLKRVRIVLGFEPNIKGRKQYDSDFKLSKEIREYWLKNGFSITLGGAVIRLIEMINTGEVDFRFMDRLHAKIYVGSEHAILGSSNFSKSGLNTQQEANIRVKNIEPLEVDEAKGGDTQYQSIKNIAENFYKCATPYNDEIKDLLQEIIQQVTWQEALARSIAEVIEGDWLKEYTELNLKLQQSKLWPSQWRGIAQAMTIIQNQSNVLIADPTGSGKTKLCSSLMLTLIHWLWENGKRNQSNSLIVCPPLVIPFWQGEFKNLTFINHNQLSMGLLSKGKERNMRQALDEIAISNIMTIDEAHNYIRPESKRSKAIQSNQADHILMATATPINKRADDLLQLIHLLDVDNLSDDDFLVYKNLKEQPRQILEKNELDSLRKFVSQFTVRRTKAQLNREVAKEPDKYLNRLGKPCKFPLQHCLTYKTEETKADKAIVVKINELILKLKGLTHLRNFSKPEYDLQDFEAEQIFISRHMKAARALASYMIRSKLRSSHAALIEHIAGAEAAMDALKFKTKKKKKTGNTLAKFEKFRLKMPDLGGFDKALFPNWLTDEKSYHKACDEEASLYEQILELVKRLSGKRELGKASHLLKLYQKHRLVLTFDSTVITLDYLKSILNVAQPEIQVIVVSGNDSGEAAKDKVLDMCSLGSTERGIILCSDKMSEGANLQQASTITLLDMPSVLRIAEQRIGRIDRMDSPHDEIEAWWPDDSEEYSLRGDRRLIDTSDLAESIFGSNLQIPQALKDKHFQKIDSIQQSIAEYKEYALNDVQWEGIQDSFKPVIELKEGDNALISEDIYDNIKDVQSSIKTRVSFIQTPYSWVFFAIRGSKHESPRWYLIDHNNGIHTDFSDIAYQLRIYLKGETKKLAWNQAELDEFINKMREREIQLLPHKRRRTLEVAKIILIQKLKSEKDSLYGAKIKEVLSLFNHGSREVIVDYYRFAEIWLKILKPYLDAKRAGTKNKRKVYNLRNLIREHRNISFSMKDLDDVLENCPYTETIDNRVAACIIGVSPSRTE